MAKLAGSLERYPARVSLYWYMTILIVGTTLLSLPLSWGRSEAPISVLDALFTATSALCVTGLSVRSTPNDFSLFGQMMIATLIQLGGVGIMTVTTMVMFQLGARGGLRQRAVVTETLGAGPKHDLKWILRRVLYFAFGIEAIGAALLFSRFVQEYPLAEAVWQSVFHSVSAFCNAGFALHDNNMVGYQDDWLVNGTLSALIILGGIGFPVLIDLSRTLPMRWPNVWDELHLHSKITILTSMIAILAGGVATLALEWNGVLRDMPWQNRLLAAFFHSVSCRTAGFNTVDIGVMSNATLLISILLMVVGAGACSTGGGVKVSTVSMLALHAISRFRGGHSVNVFRRTIPQVAIDRAMASVMFYLVVAAFALMALLVVEQAMGTETGKGRFFLDAMFEVSSALGTVGLSTGLTANLSSGGRIVIIILMFMGRLGPITVFAALAGTRGGKPIEFAREEPLVG